MQRRLAAIVHADLAGFTRMMEGSETRTFRHLKSAQHPDRLGELLRVQRERMVQRAVEVGGRHARRDRHHQPLRHGLVAAQQVVGLEARRMEGDLRGDAGMPVAVRAPSDVPL